MPYATEQDMVDRFGDTEMIDLTDRTNSGAVDSTLVGQVIDDAGDEMDSYIGSRYTLPLSVIPSVLVRVCCDIARYRLYTIEAPKEVATRYQGAITWLTQVANGVVRLGLDQTDAPAVTSDGAEIQSGGDLVFPRSDKSFI